MSQPELYEVLILGSGAGGKLLAWHMAGSGRKTAVVERRYIGGSCPNINCMPSKNEIWSAKVAHLFQRGSAGKWRGSGSCPSIEPPRTRLPPRMEKNGLAQIPRNASAQTLYVTRFGSFRPALKSLNLRFLQRLDPT